MHERGGNQGWRDENWGTRADGGQHNDGGRERDPGFSAPPPRKRAKAPIVVAGLLAVAAIGGFAVVGSGVLKHENSQTSAAPATNRSDAPTSASPATPSGPQISWAIGTAMISNGTSTVLFGSAAVLFPTPVSDAVWSPDGSRIAFVDGDGNISTARADGSSRVVAVKAPAGTTLSGPGWEYGDLFYVELGKDGKHRIRTLAGGDASSNIWMISDGNGKPIDQADDTVPSIAATPAFALDPAGLFAFQHKGSTGPEIWTHLANHQTGTENVKFAVGSWPAVSPDGKKLAYVGGNGQIMVADASATDPMQAKAGKVVQLTTGVQAPTHLAWTPDGQSIAFKTAKDVEQVAAGLPTAKPTEVSDKPGVVSFLPKATAKIVRLNGPDLTGLTIAAGQLEFKTQTGPTYYGPGDGNPGVAIDVTIGSADDPTQTSKLLSALGYHPNILVSGKTLEPRAVEEIKRLLGTPNPDQLGSGGDIVTIVGGADAVSKDVDTAITQLGYKVQRAMSPAPGAQIPAGGGGCGTAAAYCGLVVDQGDVTGVVIAQAASWWGNVIPVQGTSLIDAYKPFIDTQGPYHQAPLIPLDANSQRALAASWAGKPKNLKVAPIPGATPAEVSIALARMSKSSSITVIPADSPADLAAAECLHGPIVLVDPAVGVSPGLKSYLAEESARINRIVVIDSTGKLGESFADKLGAVYGGPLGVTNETNPQAGIAS